jgi:hypothetical protein
MIKAIVNWISVLTIILSSFLGSSRAPNTTPMTSVYPLTIQDVPIVVGEQPASDANAIVGTWSTSDLLLTATGDISGRITLTMKRPVAFPTYQDLLMVQVWATYVWPQFGDTTTQPAGDVIPVAATASSDTFVIFDLDGTFEVPGLELNIDGGMPLITLNVTMVWFRVTDRDESGYGWYGAKAGTAPQVGSVVPQLGTTLSLTGTIDGNIRSDLTYSEWFLSNPQFGAATSPSPLPTP